MDEIMKILKKCPRGTELRLEWKKGKIVLEGIVLAFYDRNNGMDAGNEEYVCAFKITSVVNNSSKAKFVSGTTLEITEQNEPQRIIIKNGNVLWG